MSIYKALILGAALAIPSVAQAKDFRFAREKLETFVGTSEAEITADGFVSFNPSTSLHINSTMSTDYLGNYHNRTSADFMFHLGPVLTLVANVAGSTDPDYDARVGAALYHETDSYRALFMGTVGLNAEIDLVASLEFFKKINRDLDVYCAFDSMVNVGREGFNLNSNRFKFGVKSSDDHAAPYVGLFTDIGYVPKEEIDWQFGLFIGSEFNQF